MSFGLSTSAAREALGTGVTPPSIGPGAYNPDSSLDFWRVRPMSGNGQSAFADRSKRSFNLAGPQVPGPGAYRPYSEMGRRARSAPRGAPKPGAAFAWSRMATPPSIPRPLDAFGFEEDESGRMRPIPTAEEKEEVGGRVGPGSYSPSPASLYRASRQCSFGRGPGRAKPLQSAGGPPVIKEGAPDWHDGTTSNPRPPLPPPASSFARSIADLSPLNRPATPASPARPLRPPGSPGGRASRGRLVPSSGIGGGGMLAEQLGERRQRASTPGPGAHATPKGVGSTCPVGSFPRRRTFRAAHLRALGSAAGTAAHRPLHGSAHALGFGAAGGGVTAQVVAYRVNR